MRAESREYDRAVPVAIRRSSLSPQNQGSFVVSLADAVSSVHFHENVRNAEREYRNAITRWARLVSRIDKDRSETLLRWKLADDIASFRSHLRIRWGIEPTNLVRAASLDLGISDTSLKYMLLLRKKFTLKDLKSGKITWGHCKVILEIRDDNLMRQCVKLVRTGQIRSEEGIREFKRKANSLHK